MFSLCALTRMVLGLQKGRSSLVLLHQKAVERGLIQATLLAFFLGPLKAFSLFEIDVGGLTSATFCILEVHVWSKVSLNRTLEKVVQGTAESRSHSHAHVLDAK